MLVFCGESWKANDAGRKVGTLAAVGVPAHCYNAVEDRVFQLAQKYFGFDNAREHEIKGRQLLSAYEYSREAAGRVSMKLSFARELLEEMRFQKIVAFGCVVHTELEVDLLCEDDALLDRPYVFLMERIELAMREQSEGGSASVVFDDRGMSQNQRVSEAYRNFLSRSRAGRSYAHLLRTPFFAYSKSCTGLQLADVVCTVINRYHTEANKSPRISQFFSLVRTMEWRSTARTSEGYSIQGIKVIGG